MANTNSKKAKKQKNLFKILRLKLSQIKSRKKVSPHKSFRRSYREDYTRDLEIPGLLSHALSSFKIIFKNWKLFLPLIAIAVVFNIVLVGIMSEATYVQFQTHNGT